MLFNGLEKSCGHMPHPSFRQYSNPSLLCVNGMIYYFFGIAEYDRFTEEWELVDVKKFSQLGTQERVKDKEGKIAYYGM